MSKITLQLASSLDTRKLIDSSGGGTPDLPALVQGDAVACQLRLYTSVNNALTEVIPQVRSLRASLGNPLDPATSGTVQLTLGAVTTAWMDLGSLTPNVIKSALNAGGGGVQAMKVENPVAATWLVQTNVAASAAAPVCGGNSRLEPESFVRARAYPQSGFWWIEFRFIVAPLAFTGDFARVLPNAPSIAEVQLGGSGSDNPDIVVDEVQSLTLPSDFAGSYTLNWNFRKSAVLGKDDGPDQIAAALNGMWSDGAVRFKCTNPVADQAYIEFTGALGNAAQPLITVEVVSFPPGVLTFTLDLATAELATALRAVASITVPLEVELEIVPDGTTDPSITGTILTAFQQDFTVNRSAIWPELATVETIDWLKPPVAQDYIPFTPDQIITGSQFYTAVFGDGATLVFNFPHNLGTTACHLTVVQNAEGGRVLELGVDYTATVSDNATVITMLGAVPAANTLVVIISTAGPKSAFQAHTHTIAQIIGLQDALDALDARVTAIEDKLPTVSPSTPSGLAGGTALTITIPDHGEFFPGRGNPAYVSGATAALFTSRPPALLPAIHDAVVAALAVPPPAASTVTGQVFQNQTGAPIIIPGGMGNQGGALAANGYAGSDGRMFYALSNVAGTDSYFPTDMERELFAFEINEQMLVAGTTFTLNFKLNLQTFNATSRIQHVLLVEWGDVPSQPSPAPTATNLQDIEWNATPIFAQRLISSGVAINHQFGAAIVRAADGSLTSNKLLYSLWTAGASCPDSANFAIRARLVQFDTENSVVNARGIVSYGLNSATATIA